MALMIGMRYRRPAENTTRWSIKSGWKEQTERGMTII